MIYEDNYWKQDLLKLANKIEKRLIQEKWYKRSFFALEKEIFIGFYIIRKLIESNAVNIKILNKKSMKVESAKKKEISILSICNQFIHSYIFSPYIIEKKLIGIFVSSDYKKETGCYLITIFEIIDIYRSIGNCKN